MNPTLLDGFQEFNVLREQLNRLLPHIRFQEVVNGVSQHAGYPDAREDFLNLWNKCQCPSAIVLQRLTSGLQKFLASTPRKFL